MDELRVMLLGDRRDLCDGDMWRPDAHTPGERQYKWRTDRDFVNSPDFEFLVIARPLHRFAANLTKSSFDEWHRAAQEQHRLDDLENVQRQKGELRS